MTEHEQQKLAEAKSRLEALCDKLWLKFGSEATARMLIEISRKHADRFMREVELSNLRNRPPSGYA